jgi:hypothetical protein
MAFRDNPLGSKRYMPEESTIPNHNKNCGQKIENGNVEGQPCLEGGGGPNLT